MNNGFLSIFFTVTAADMRLKRRSFIRWTVGRKSVSNVLNLTTHDSRVILIKQTGYAQGYTQAKAGIEDEKGI